MYRNKTVSVVIPCYNEEEGIRYVIGKMPEFVDEVVVVDNNCTDRTAEVARELGAVVVFEGRKGYGRAYRTGIPAAKSDIVVTMDGDGTYPVEEIQPTLDYLMDKDLHFVTASRFPLKQKGSMHTINQLGNWALTVATMVLFLRKIRDSQSGMWAFYSWVYPKLGLECDGMDFSGEIKLEAILNKEVRFGESHIDYHPRIGEVKLNMWQDGWMDVVWLLKRRLRRKGQ